MNRLTEKSEDGCNIVRCENGFVDIGYIHYPEGALFGDVIDRLAAYEDAEERGELVRLPCKVGDTMYYKRGCEICEEKVRTFFVGHPSHRIEERNMKMIRAETHDIPFDCLGKTVFLTREEAEAALANMREDTNDTKDTDPCG